MEAEPPPVSDAPCQSNSDLAALRCNPAGASWVVQKFGGTSVGKCLLSISQHILPSTLDSGHRVAIVCSARSGDTKLTGTTNLLLKAALQALTPVSNVHDSPPRRLSGRSTPNGPAHPLALSQVLPRGASTPSRVSRTNSFLSGFVSPPAHSSGSPLAFSRLQLGPDSADVDIENGHAFDETVESIKSDHLQAAARVVESPALLSELKCDISYDCERLRSLLLAAQILGEISPRSKDLIVGVGERLSCRIVTACLIDKGFDAELVCLDSIVDKPDAEENDSNLDDGITSLGGQLRQAFYDRLASKLGERLRQCENRIPVITGFFGVVPGSLLTQIGRGYTDLCASLCAVGLKASELQVWKEVDGIFTADPRKVPAARLLGVVTPDEAAELTYYGSEVIHPFTMEQVIRASIPIRIKNVMNFSGVGTIIYPDRSIPSSPAGVDTASRSDLHLQGKAPTAITSKDNIVVLNIHSNRKTISHGFFANIFGTLDRFGVVVDLISTSEVHVSMAMMIGEAYRKNGLEKLVRELKSIGEVSVLEDMAILSLVGRQMKNMVGIAGRMFGTLAAANVNIEMISQGASEINISCVISSKDAARALNLVHDNLIINFSP